MSIYPNPATNQSIAHVYWIHRREQSNKHLEGYIGVSVNPKSRLRGHIKRGNNPHLTNAFNKYDDIELTIIHTGPVDECYALELSLRPNDDIGWNIVKGGGKPPDNTGKPRGKYKPTSRRGKSFTNEHRKNISKARQGIKMPPRSDEYKETLKDRTSSFWNKLTPEELEDRKMKIKIGRQFQLARSSVRSARAS